MLFVHDVISVRVCIVFLRTFTPFSVVKSHLSVKSVSVTAPVSHSVMSFILSELRILHIVEDDGRVRHLKIFFSSILLINVDFPENVSPKRHCRLYQFILKEFLRHSDIYERFPFFRTIYIRDTKFHV